MSFETLDVKVAVAAINRYRERQKHSKSEVARRTGVHQSQVSRILNGHCRHMKGALRKLCKYAEVDAGQAAEADPAGSPELMNALRVAWDGTEDGARALARVILAVAQVQRR